MFSAKKNISVMAFILTVCVAGVLSGCTTVSQGDTMFLGVLSAEDNLHGAMGCHSPDEKGLCVEKTMPKEIQAGKPFEYTLQVTNMASCVLDHVLITEKVPDPFLIVKTSLASAKISGPTLEWDLGSLKPEETRTLTIRGTAQDTTSMSSCTHATFRSTLCLNPKVLPPDLRLILEAPKQITLCDGIPLKLTVSNTRKDPIENITITQSLPEGLQTTADHKTFLRIDIDRLPGKVSKSYDLPLKVSKVGSYSFKMDAVSGDFRWSSNGVTTLAKQPALKVNVTGPGKVFVTQDATYEIKLKNEGGVAATNTMVAMQVPAGMKFESAVSGGKEEAGKVVWKTEKIDPGQEIHLSAVLEGIAAGSVQSVVNVQGACCQEVSASVKTEVEGIPALHLECTDSDDPIRIGGIEIFHVSLTNQGSGAAKNIVLKATLEKNFDYVSSSGPTLAKAENTKFVEFSPLLSLAPKQKITWEIKAKAVEEGDHRFNVSVTGEGVERPIEKKEPTRVY